jgi:hypothetical protein
MQNYRINRALKNATEVHSKNIYNVPLTFINNCFNKVKPVQNNTHFYSPLEVTNIGMSEVIYELLE